MKKQIMLWLSISIVTVMSLVLILNFYLQLSNAESVFEKSAIVTLDQMESIIVQNDEYLASITVDAKEEYTIRAVMAAYVLDNVVAETAEELLALTQVLDVDEIHLFNTDGLLYASSVPAYIGYTFYSGEQMQFFLPMLNDKHLSLCQDITPNTAESKSMIYAAVWRSDGSGIVQIGLEPERLLEAQKQNELSYIFTTMPVSNDMNLHAIDADTGIVLGSTSNALVGQIDNVIRNTISESENEQSFYAQINGVDSICVFREFGDVYIGITQDVSVLNTDIWGSTLNVATHIIIAGIVLLLLVLKIIHYSVLDNINVLIEKMTQIAGGNLDVKVEIDTSPEFEALSEHLNTLVASLLSTTDRLSQVLDKVNVNLAIYEYKEDMDRVLATANIGILLDLFPAEVDLLLANKASFLYKLAGVHKNLVEGTEDVYDLDGRGEHFVRMESYTDADGTYGVIVEVTDEVLELRRMSYERDYDVLTDLYNRRGFFTNLEYVLQKENLFEHVLVMGLDMDNLKHINDAYGHAGGDNAIQACANILKGIETPYKLAARMGGDEFALVIYGAQSKERLEAHVATLQAAAQNIFIMADGVPVQVKMSGGYTYYAADDGEALTYATLEKQADEALYRAKRNGRAQFVAY